MRHLDPLLLAHEGFIPLFVLKFPTTASSYFIHVVTHGMQCSREEGRREGNC